MEDAKQQEVRVDATQELSLEELADVSGGTVRKAGSGTTSGGGVYLRYWF
jgi:hypothetical protein